MGYGDYLMTAIVRDLYNDINKIENINDKFMKLIII